MQIGVPNFPLPKDVNLKVCESATKSANKQSSCRLTAGLEVPGEVQANGVYCGKNHAEARQEVM